MSRTLAGVIMAGAAVPGALALPLPGAADVPPAVAVVQAARAGCPQLDRDQLVMATAISMAESNGRPEAEGDTTITDHVWGPSLGLWQVRTIWDQEGTGQPRDAARLHDPLFNARSMCSLSNAGETWQPWSVWLHGTYRDRLAEAEEAVDDPRSGAPPSAAAPAAVATDPAARPKLGARFDEGYQDLGGLIDVGCEHVDGQPRLSAACAAAQRAWWGDQQAGDMDTNPSGNRSNPYMSSAAPTSWLAPCEGPVTSGFGPRAAPIEGARTFHPGLDLACGLGTPAKAAAAGQVIFAGWDGGFGNSVQVEHPGGTSTSYNHLSAVMVAEGQRVAAGGTVGLVGSTGVSTGPHLHFELWEGGVPVDPAGRLGP